MIQRCLFTLVGLVLIGGCQSVERMVPGLSPDEAKQLSRAVRDWHEAIRRKDASALDLLLVDDYVAINPMGQEVPKLEDLKLLAQPGLEFDEFTPDQIKIRDLGEAAVVSCRTHVRGSVNGQRFMTQYRTTYVFQKIEDEWRGITAHSSQLPPEKPDSKPY